VSARKHWSVSSARIRERCPIGDELDAATSTVRDVTWRSAIARWRAIVFVDCDQILEGRSHAFEAVRTHQHDDQRIK